MNDILTKQKLAIAKLLPEKLAMTVENTQLYWIDKSTKPKENPFVLDTEWLQIVQWVEDGLTCKSTYLAELAHVCGFGTISPLDEKYDEMIFRTVHATYQQRLAALEAAGIINTTKE